MDPRHDHITAPYPASCEACRAVWLALRAGTVSPPEADVVAKPTPQDDKPRGVETLY